MAKHKEEKTNVMRILEQKKIPYTAHAYEENESPLGDREYGLHIARTLGQPVDRVYKTLVARGASKAIYVFCIPVAESLDLKKAAKAVGEKS
ncbi:MAG: Cys-tRNA(Pro) deacylase, partial [Oscillospiraceae bacterium]|nr:Cys-tRNA(Pro) deacylase [Oscillospiraceae bacterium]